MQEAGFRPDRWFEALRKPPFDCRCVFAPVWTILYIAIATSAMAWARIGGGYAWTPALTLWAIQLALNGIWSWLFFARHRIGLALADIVGLLAVIVAYSVTVGAAKRARRVALRALRLVGRFRDVAQRLDPRAQPAEVRGRGLSASRYARRKR